MSIGVDESDDAPDLSRFRRGRRGLDVESSLQERLGRRRGEDRVAARRRASICVEDVLSGLSRIGVELDTILEPPNQHLLRVQRDPQLGGAGDARGTDDALHGKRGVGRMARRVFDDIQAERRLDGGRAHLDDAAAETRWPSPRSPRARGRARAPRAVSWPSSTSRLKQRDARPLPSHALVRHWSGRATRACDDD